MAVVCPGPRSRWQRGHVCQPVWVQAPFGHQVVFTTSALCACVEPTDPGLGPETLARGPSLRLGTSGAVQTAASLPA